MIISLENINTVLKSITEEDAELICNVRNDPSINQYLSSSVPVSTTQQRDWINNNKKKDGAYFKILDKVSSTFLGTVSIYNVDKIQRNAEFGRYICKSSLHAIEAELMMIQWSFEIIGLKKIFCKTSNDNIKVWKQHYKFGFKDAGTETLAGTNMLLKRQELTESDYHQFNYEPINELIERFRD